MGVQLIETSLQNPLPPDTVGLLLGRSSVALRGLTIIPGVIDSDFTGTIKIMVQALLGTVLVNKGDKIAQLLVLPSLHKRFPVEDSTHGDRGFGSSGDVFEGRHLTLQEWPMLTLLKACWTQGPTVLLSLKGIGLARGLLMWRHKACRDSALSMPLRSVPRF